VDTAVGFAGGTVPEPSYKLVCSGDTGHAEVVHIKFDKDKVSYDQLLDIFWSIHDPTQVDRQGLDVGAQYRSVIFYYDEKQRAKAERSKQELQKRLTKPIATQIQAAAKFFKAEEYHQQYYKKKRR
jgi:peptide-methionine (S)-S-oxide reductase